MIKVIKHGHAPYQMTCKNCECVFTFEDSDIKNNVSLQRADIVVLNNAHLALSGATDRTNEYSQVVFSLSRVTELDLKNSSEIYLENGANLLTRFKSLKANGEKAEVDIDEDTHEVDRNGTNNRLYIKIIIVV